MNTPDFESAAREVFSGIRKSGYQKDFGVNVSFQDTEKGRSCWARWCRDPNNPIHPRNIVWVWQDEPFAFLGLFVRMNGSGEWFDLTNDQDNIRKRRLEKKVQQWLDRKGE